MSPFFKPSNIAKYTPKTIRFSQLYAHNTGAKKKVGPSVLFQAKEALTKAGVNENDVFKIISHDKPISVSQMKAVAEVMNRSKIYGFEKDPKNAINDLLNKERIKAQSIAGIIKEHSMEAMTEDLPEISTTSLNPHGVSPNKALPKAKERATFNLGRERASKPTGSLSRTSRSASTGSPSSTGSNFKPKF